MEFTEAITKVKQTLNAIGSDISTDKYDGLIVKKLESSNTLDDDRSTNQTHIAITGNQMDIFPYVRADGYFDVEYEAEDNILKKYFVIQIPTYLHKENVQYLKPDASELFSDEHLVHISVVRSRRRQSADQVQMSMINIDSPAYKEYRKLVHAKTYMILLKRERQLVYDLYSVKEADGEGLLQDLNNGFYKLRTNTPVEADAVLLEDKVKQGRILLPFEQSKECARQIVDCIYDIDAFARLKDVLENNDKNIKVNTDTMGGNYLRYMFAKPTSIIYDSTSGVKTRVFRDREYNIRFDSQEERCRLSTEWVSSELGENHASANYLRALIKVVNGVYKDILQIFEEEGKWYLEYLVQRFTLSRLPDSFQNPFAKRYITSLLAKPFTILTGNSGTGKTRIAKQFAEYLEVHSDDGQKNWALISVGADWTDNTKILGFYNPFADEGKGQYEKTEILRLIEYANQNKDKPYFIILDEMNLSHVERYFSDFLSHMETNHLPFVIDGYDGKLEYPSNLFIVGTVNIDETTYMFSPKVLDRANVIEFKPNKEAIIELFKNPISTKDTLPANNGTAEAFLKLANAVRGGVCGLSEAQLDEVQRCFQEIYDITKLYGYEFAFRTAKEIRQYVSAAYELADNKEHFDLIKVVDEQLLQKILPKIHGNKKEISQLLDDLGAFCDEKELKLSGEKIKQMKGKLAKVQYASFI